MLGEIIEALFEGLFGDAFQGRRSQVFFRILFGLLGVGLGFVGAWHIAFSFETGNMLFRLSGVALMLFMSAFFGLNVVLLRTMSWTWKGFAACFAAMFLTRIIGGP